MLVAKQQRSVRSLPHIHTLEGQHDMTVSMYIVRVDGNEPRCLLHMHRKLGMLLQIGGHVELNETPWQAIEHEMREESGFTFDEVKVLQQNQPVGLVAPSIEHPVPFISETHPVPGDSVHYHSDFGYAFVATAEPQNAPDETESVDLRWLTLDEMQVVSETGEMAPNRLKIYRYIIETCLPSWHRIDPKSFTL